MAHYFFFVAQRGENGRVPGKREPHRSQCWDCAAVYAAYGLAVAAVYAACGLAVAAASRYERERKRLWESFLRAPYRVQETHASYLKPSLGMIKGYISHHPERNYIRSGREQYIEIHRGLMQLLRTPQWV